MAPTLVQATELLQSLGETAEEAGRIDVSLDLS